MAQLEVLVMPLLQKYVTTRTDTISLLFILLCMVSVREDYGQKMRESIHIAFFISFSTPRFFSLTLLSTSLISLS